MIHPRMYVKGKNCGLTRSPVRAVNGVHGICVDDSSSSSCPGHRLSSGWWGLLTIWVVGTWAVELPQSSTMQQLHRLSIGGGRGRPRYKHVTQLRDCGWSFLGSDLTGSLQTHLVSCSGLLSSLSPWSCLLRALRALAAIEQFWMHQEGVRVGQDIVRVLRVIHSEKHAGKSASHSVAPHWVFPKVLFCFPF